MYVLLVRPQQRKVREQRELVRQVGVGAEVQTIGGILGRVVAADDQYVHIEISPGVVVTFVRAAVGRILDAPPDDTSYELHDDPEMPEHEHEHEQEHQEEPGPEPGATGTEGGPG